MRRRDFLVGTAGIVLAEQLGGSPFGIARAAATSGRKLIIEVRANEWTMRRVNSHIPYTTEEIVGDAVECGRAGASVFHFHCRTPEGAPELGYGAYRDIVTGIREKSEILIHPTLGSTRSSPTAADRFSNIMRLVRENIAPDIVPIDMATINTDRYDESRKDFDTDTNVYVNTTATQKYLAEQARADRLKPCLVCYGAASIRQAEALARSGRLDQPLYLSFALCDYGYVFAPPSTVEGLLSYIDFLPSGIPVQWTAFDVGGNLFPLVGTIIQLGGHIQIGLGDYPYPEIGRPTNAELVRRCVEIAKECGREVASANDARDMLGMRR